MSNYKCPLCHQSVTKALYEKITGIWKEKEQKLAALKQKEKELRQKEANLRKSFEKQKQDLEKKFNSQIKHRLDKQEKQFKLERDKIKKDNEKIRENFRKQLEKAVNDTMKSERKKLKDQEDHWKKQLKASRQKAIDDAKNVLAKQKKQLENKEKQIKNRNERILQQYQTLQNKSAIQLEKADSKIKSLEEQLAKNQTPQVLGLLEESKFLSKLRELFPNDQFKHTGKGGDIVHHVAVKGKEIGTIVYELKKVAKFNNKHIQQTLDAKQLREADYGILVTNAKRSKVDSGFSISKGVIIIHPTAVLVLVKILRDHLITISKLKLTVSQRKKTVDAVLQYIQSANFKNSVESIIQNTVDLYDDMKKEVEKHIKTWKYRLDKYRSINTDSNLIQDRVVHLLDGSGKKDKTLPIKIAEIMIPNKLK